MKIRVIAGAIMVIVVVPIFLMGGIYVKALGALILGAGLTELLGICHKRHWSYLIDVFVYIYGFYIMFFDQSHELFSSHLFFVFFFIMLICALIFASFSIQEVFYLTVMTTFLAVAGKSLISIDETYHYAAILYIACANFGCDTGAYFAGVKFGKHKLIPRISPKKTIEGSIGGMVLGTFLATFVGYLCHLPLSLSEMFLLAFLMTIVAQIGDLTFSAIKRHANIKDYSQLIPGHGGVLDRVDSLLFNIIAFSLWIWILH